MKHTPTLVIDLAELTAADNDPNTVAGERLGTYDAAFALAGACTFGRQK